MTQLDTCIDPGTPCFYFANSGRVRRVVGHGTRAVRGIPPSVRIAASGRRIAVVVAVSKGTNPEPTPSTQVEVHDAISGALISRFAPNGQAQALDVGLGPRIVAVLVQGRCLNCRLIERHAAGNGKWLGVTPVPTNATDLSMSGRNVVFRSGRSIRYLDAATGESRVLARATSTPVGLSAEGRWAVWGERYPGRSRIVAVAFH